MNIVYLDGSILHCNYIEFSGGLLIADGVYYVDLNEIDHIE